MTRKRRTTLLTRPSNKRDESAWSDILARRAAEELSKGTTLLTRPLESEKKRFTPPDWVVVGEEEIDGKTLLSKGSKIKAPVFGDKDGKPFDREYQPLIRQIHLLTTDPTYATFMEHQRNTLQKYQAASERPWTKDGMFRYLEKTGHGQRAMDVFERKGAYFLPTKKDRAQHDRKEFQMPMKLSGLAAALAAVHESVHTDEPGWSDDLLDNVVEEYKATRKQVEAYKDLKRQGIEPDDPAVKEEYENFERLYDLDDQNDGLTRFIFDYYVPYYRQALTSKNENPFKTKRQAREERKDKPINQIDSWSYTNDLLFMKFKQRLRNLDKGTVR